MTHSPGSTGPCGHRLGFDRLAAARLERAGDARAHPECVVGGVDDGVGRFGGEVAVQDLQRQRREAERNQRF
jgi:hypothetical protein